MSESEAARAKRLLRMKEYRKSNREKLCAYLKNYYQKHKEKAQTVGRLYYSKHKERVAKVTKIYRGKNKPKALAYNLIYVKNRKAIDPEFKLRCNLRHRLCTAIKKGHKAGSFVRDLGCSIPELKKYLESKFEPGMSWSNWSRNGWHIDHILPLAIFDLSNRDEFLKACHYTNLQPMWAAENMKKSKKVIEFDITSKGFELVGTDG